MENSSGKPFSTPGRRDFDLVPRPHRLEKEYAAMKSKEMEEQIEIKVSSKGTEMGSLEAFPYKSRTGR